MSVCKVCRFVGYGCLWVMVIDKKLPQVNVTHLPNIRDMVSSQDSFPKQGVLHAHMNLGAAWSRVTN